MKKVTIIALTLSFFGLCGYGQPKEETGDKALRQTLFHLRDSFSTAQHQGNRSVLEQLVADSFYFVHSTGVVTNRKEFIERTLAQAGKGPVIEFKEQRLFIYNHSTALWLSRSTSKSPQEVETNFRATDVLVKNKTKGWQWVSVHSTKLATRPKAFPISGDSLRMFVGSYQISPERTLQITLADDMLVGQALGFRQRALMPVSASEFVWFSPDSNVDMRPRFNWDTAGQTPYATLTTEGSEVWHARKLK